MGFRVIGVTGDVGQRQPAVYCRRRESPGEIPVPTIHEGRRVGMPFHPFISRLFAFLAAACVIAVGGVRGGVRRVDAPSRQPLNFLFSSSSNPSAFRSLLKRPDIEGVQVVYNWRSLEPEKGRYDFSRIEQDLKVVDAAHKKLFVQVQDRFFSPQDKNVPKYLMTDPIYDGGITAQSDHPGEGKPLGSGWVADQWNPQVRKRFQLLLRALARRFDGKIYGINLPETAVEVDAKRHPAGFTCDKYFQGELDNLRAAGADFKKSYVVQYVNFWPCEWNNDHKYMSRVFAFAARHGIGLGGPDIVPYRRGQMKNSYPFFHAYKGKLALVAMAVQGATLTYTNPATGKKFTKSEFVAFARDYLGARIIFWSTSSPWLHEEQAGK